MTTSPTNSDTKSATDPGEQLNATLSQEQRRRYMLDQLGIVPLISIRDGVAAKASVRIAAPAMTTHERHPQDMSSGAKVDSAVASDGVTNGVTDGVTDGVADGVTDIAALRATLRSANANPRAKPAESANVEARVPAQAVSGKTTVDSSSASVQASAPSVTFQLLIASTGRWLWAEVLSDGLIRQEQLQLIQAMGRVLDGPKVAIKHLQFDWPMASHPQLPKDINAAKQSVAGQLQRLAKDASASGLIILGDEAMPFISEAINLTRLEVPSTVTMLQEPQRKRDAWAVIKPHVVAD
jgi:hypothetical protein